MRHLTLPKTVMLNVGLAIAYLAIARLSFYVAFSQANVSPFWPPAGLALAAVLLWGCRLWPGVALGSLLGALSLGTPWLVSLGTGLGAAVAAVLGAALLRRTVGTSPFERVRDVYAFVAIATVLPAPLSALIGSGFRWSLGLTTLERLPMVIWTWWMGDIVGILIATPLIVAWWHQKDRPSPPLRLMEGFLALGAIFLAGMAVFGGWFPTGETSYPLAYLPFPLLIWAALRLGLPGATAGVLMLGLVSTYGTLHGLGPFARWSLDESLLLIQTFIGVSALTGLIFAGSMAERQRAEAELAVRNQELKRANEDLKALDQLKSSFLSVVSHELRTPLTSIRGYTEFLEDELAGPLTEDQRRFVVNIQESTRRLEYQVDDLLDMSRFDSGNYRLNLAHADLVETVRGAVESLQPMSRERGIHLETDLPASPRVLFMDRARIEQVVLNLVGNALKFTWPEGAVKVRVTDEADRLRVAISDTGRGIAEQHLERIFDRFYQVEPGLTRDHGGAGLGLAICKAIVQEHGGRIGVESRLGEGTTFWFVLPALAQSDSPPGEPDCKGAAS